MEYIPDTNLTKHLPDSSWCILQKHELVDVTIFLLYLFLFFRQKSFLLDQISLVKETWDLKLINLNK